MSFYWENLKMGRVFSTGKFDMIRVSQYLINGLKGGCKGHKYSKNLKKPLSSSTGMTSETLIYHNACIYYHPMGYGASQILGDSAIVVLGTV